MADDPGSRPSVPVIFDKLRTNVLLHGLTAAELQAGRVAGAGRAWPRHGKGREHISSRPLPFFLQ